MLPQIRLGLERSLHDSWQALYVVDINSQGMLEI